MIEIRGRELAADDEAGDLVLIAVDQFERGYRPRILLEYRHQNEAGVWSEWAAVRFDRLSDEGAV